jgi:hypothetical protein
MKITVSWDVTPCSLVERYQCCCGTCCVHPEGRASHSGNELNKQQLSGYLKMATLKGHGQTLKKKSLPPPHARIVLNAISLCLKPSTIKPIPLHVRFEVLTAVTMKNGIFRDVTPCDSCKVLTEATRRNIPEDAILLFHYTSLSKHFWPYNFKGRHQNPPTAVHGAHFLSDSDLQPAVRLNSVQLIHFHMTTVAATRQTIFITMK